MLENDPMLQAFAKLSKKSQLYLANCLFSAEKYYEGIADTRNEFALHVLSLEGDQAANSYAFRRVVHVGEDDPMYDRFMAFPAKLRACLAKMISKPAEWYMREHIRERAAEGENATDFTLASRERLKERDQLKNRLQAEAGGFLTGNLFEDAVKYINDRLLL